MKFLKLCWSILCLLIIALKSFVVASFIDNYIELLNPNEDILNDIDGFIIYCEENLEYLQTLIVKYKQENLIADKEDFLYFSNPINVFSFTRHLTIDIIRMEEFIDNQKSRKNIELLRIKLKFPNKEDLMQAAENIYWLQDIYNLSTSNLKNGQIKGIHYNTALKISDLIHLGVIAHNVRDYYHSILWLTEAFRSDDEDDSLHLNIAKVLAQSCYEIGDVKSALHFIEIAAELSEDTSVENIKEYYEENINKHFMEKEKYLKEFPSNLYQKLKGLNNFSTLCRDEIKQDIKKFSSLKCDYINNNIPFLLIAPFKREIHSYDPYVVVFYDAVYDKEIEQIKNISSSKFVDAPVIDFTSKKEELSTDRTSKIFWLLDYDFVVRIKQRGSDFTNLNMDPSDSMINKYEIGAHYGIHYDYINTEMPLGDRIASQLIYLNDVEQGGETIFPILDIKIKPKKGSALFWYNLHSSGEIDNRTAHAGCPILVGYKLCKIFK